MSYVFTNNWFHYSEIRKLLLCFIDNNSINKILEIGSHEGQSSCYFSDYLLDHPESSLTCVDPYDTTDPTTPVTDNTKNIFLNNIGYSKNFNKIIFNQSYSSDFYIKNNLTYTFIYIDGSHLIDDITLDFNNCLNIIEPKGIIWMDDYDSSTEVKNHINNLYELNKDKIQIIHKGYQIAFQKK
jgi:predicted O-methyltransferase YrrM